MSVIENIRQVKACLEKAAVKVGRNPDEIKLLAVTKTHPVAIIETALANGIEFIAENRLQEAEKKLPELEGKFKEFHFIGHLQSNKIKKLMQLNPTLIHSIDNLKTAQKLNDYLMLYNRKQNILIQVNTSGEASKFGIEPADTKNFVQAISRLSQLHVRGLMTIGKLTDNQTEIRRCFQLLHSLFEELKSEELPHVEMKYLSMGMSGDYQLAIAEGANIVRLGSAIFGARN